MIDEERVDAVVIRVNPNFDRESRPSAVIVAEAYLRATAGRVEPRKAIDRRWEPELDLSSLIDAHGLRAWRSLRQHQMRYEGRGDLTEALQLEMAALSWANDALPVVAVRIPGTSLSVCWDGTVSPPSSRADRR